MLQGGTVVIRGVGGRFASEARIEKLDLSHAILERSDLELEQCGRCVLALGAQLHCWLSQEWVRGI